MSKKPTVICLPIIFFFALLSRSFSIAAISSTHWYKLNVIKNNLNHKSIPFRMMLYSNLAEKTVQQSAAQMFSI